MPCKAPADKHIAMVIKLMCCKYEQINVAVIDAMNKDEKNMRIIALTALSVKNWLFIEIEFISSIRQKISVNKLDIILHLFY